MFVYSVIFVNICLRIIVSLKITKFHKFEVTEKLLHLTDIVICTQGTSKEIEHYEMSKWAIDFIKEILRR